jgi:hypothetical protein
MTERRRPMRRLGDVLPNVASGLGLDEQLRLARQMSSWERLIEEHVPAAAGASSLLAVQPPALVVSAATPIVAQELRLRADELLRVFASLPGGTRQLELRVSVRPVGASPRRPHGGGSRERPGV